MRKVEYYIPESREELESLVGKQVILCPPFTYSPSFPGEPFTYFGFNNDTHDIRQVHDIDRIRTLLIVDRNLEFVRYGVLGREIQNRDYKDYTPRDNGYQERLKVLQDNESWKDVD
ncbi:hypothetical protein J4221_04495 [Candidatus Pacearchaeota archaeon]|nr:hypothetical protein [Candidatus Pacearchaeota archaeon]